MITSLHVYASLSHKVGFLKKAMLVLAIALCAGNVVWGAVKVGPQGCGSDVYNRKWTRGELEEVLASSEKWLDNQIGREEVAPPPWTPMEVSDQSVLCWAKEFRYDHSLLPVSITALGEELLAGRIVVRVKVGKKWLEFDKASVSLQKKHDGLVTAKAVACAGDLTLETTVGYEFDGMGKVHLSLSAPETCVVEGVQLEIPLIARRSVLFHVTGARSDKVVDGMQNLASVAIPPMSDSGGVSAQGRIFDVLREIVWLGDRESGLCWFCDGLKGWPIKDENNIQVITPERNKARSLLIKLADKPFNADKPHTWVFGLQATPMRPRNIDFRTQVGREDWPWLSCSPLENRWEWGDGYYYPFQDTYPDEARADVEATRAKGRELMPTSSLSFFGIYRFARNMYGPVSKPGLMQREVLLWMDHWNLSSSFKGTKEEAVAHKNEAIVRREKQLPGVRSLEEVLALPRHTAPNDDWDDTLWQPRTYPSRFCYNSSFQNYYIWKLAELVKRTSVSAIYLDQQVAACANAAHGCGYIDCKGEWSSHANIFAMREMTKRIYMVFSQINGHAPQIMWHCSQQMAIPAMSFCTIYYDGEKYNIPSSPRNIVNNEFYSDFLTEEVLQVQHMGRPFGFTPDFLPQLMCRAKRGRKEMSPSLATTRDLLGLTMLHDSHLGAYALYYPDFVKMAVPQRLSYPLGKMKVGYYWESKTGVATWPETMRYIIHYDQERALLILYNWGDDTVLAETTLQPDVLGVKAERFQAQDILSGQKLETTDYVIKADVLPRDFRMIEVRWQ